MAEVGTVDVSVEDMDESKWMLHRLAQRQHLLTVRKRQVFLIHLGALG